jgi:hypothetical protein
MFLQTFLLILGLVALALLGYAIHRAIRSFIRYRGLRVVTCPETQEAVGVKVDQSYAALTSITDAPDLRLKSCTRWPERHDCDQDCLLQIAANPEGTRYWNQMIYWYEGQACAFCGKVFGRLDWSERKPALMDANRNLYEWIDVLPERLTKVLETHKPVCWSCYIAECFHREHPDLVTERNYRTLKLG